MGDYVVKQIHEASMRILHRTGMKFLHSDAQRILREHGIDVDGEGVARFTEEQLMYWVHKAPSHIYLYAPDQANTVVLGGDTSEPAPCTGCPTVSDQEGNMRKAEMEDYVKLVKLFEANPKFHVSGHAIVLPNDVPVEHAYPLMHYAAYTHSNKALLVGMGNYQDCEDMLQMGLAAAGSKEEMEAHPNMMTIVNVDAPLRLDKKMTETLISFAKYKQPVMVACCDMAGTTAPVTLAGAIAQTNAELLGAIALVEMVSPGCPVMYGAVSTTADLRNGSIAMGAPEAAIFCKYTAKLAKYYGLPCRGGGTETDAKTVDVQAGYESMMNYLVSKQNKINLILHSAGILDGFLTMSYEKVIADFEIMDYVDRLMEDVTLGEGRIPEDLMDEVGHDGQYLTEEHTFEFCRKEPLTPALAVRGATDDRKGQYMTNLYRKMESMLESYKKPERDERVIQRMREILIARGVEPELLTKIENM